MLQIIYVSAATQKFGAADLTELLSHARDHNSDAQISGILVYHAGSFLQVLEGPEDAVQSLFGKIEKDPRHGQIRILLRQNRDAKEFGDWSMAFVDTKGGAQNLPGFIDYASDLQTLAMDEGQARKVLGLFQEGQWRQQLET